MTPEEILERRLQKEAERLDEPVEATRRRMLEAGLTAARAQREREAAMRRLTVDVVLVTATMTEHRQLREAALSLGLPFEKQQGRFGPYYHLGTIGSNRVASMQVQMGAFGAEGAAARCIQARAETQATMLILLGTAFGVDPTQQRIGDVLVSESVFLYDDRHATDPQDGSRLSAGVRRLAGYTERATPAGWPLARRLARRVRSAVGPGFQLSYPPTARRAASMAWVARFRLLAEELRRAGEADRITVGTMLSGGARIESARFRDELLVSLPALDPPVVGGEMEAMGAVSASTSDPQEPGWIVVKGIVDFADAASRAEVESNRDHAAGASARAVLRALRGSATFG